MHSFPACVSSVQHSLPVPVHTHPLQGRPGRSIEAVLSSWVHAACALRASMMQSFFFIQSVCRLIVNDTILRKRKKERKEGRGELERRADRSTCGCRAFGLTDVSLVGLSVCLSVCLSLFVPGGNGQPEEDELGRPSETKGESGQKENLRRKDVRMETEGTSYPFPFTIC